MEGSWDIPWLYLLLSQHQEERRKRSKFKSQPQLRRQACSRSDVMYRPMNFEVASQLLNIAASHMKFTIFSASDQQQQRAQKTPKERRSSGNGNNKVDWQLLGQPAAHQPAVAVTRGCAPSLNPDSHLFRQFISAREIGEDEREERKVCGELFRGTECSDLQARRAPGEASIVISGFLLQPAATLTQQPLIVRAMNNENYQQLGWE